MSSNAPRFALFGVSVVWKIAGLQTVDPRDLEIRLGTS
jgi:hypothetical protein